jgi:hypothetical protein
VSAMLSRQLSSSAAIQRITQRQLPKIVIRPAGHPLIVLTVC